VANLVEVPDSLPLVDAAATVLSGLAAWHVLVSKVSIKPGQRILVVAAGGGVGTWAVQIAKWAGLHVIATVGAREKMARVQALGAEAIVHRGAPAWGDHVRALTDGQGVDVVFDTAGAATWDESWRALSRGGTVALCGATGGGLVGLDLLTVFREEYHIVGVTGGTYGELQQLMRAVAGGLLKPVIDQTAPLAAAREMHQRLESRRVVGKVILTA
jgi:NADPH:quinone reductase-like Zn-dependent oxidoreductase